MAPVAVTCELGIRGTVRRGRGPSTCCVLRVAYLDAVRTRTAGDRETTAQWYSCYLIPDRVTRATPLFQVFGSFVDAQVGGICIVWGCFWSSDHGVALRIECML